MAKFVIVLMCMVGLGFANQMKEQLHSSDLLRMKEVLESPSRTGDVCTLYHSVNGLIALDMEVGNKPKICEHFKHFQTTASELESLFCLAAGSKKVGCVSSLTAQQTKTLEEGLTNKASVQSIYFGYSGLQDIGKLSTKSSEIVSSLKEVLRKDDTPASYAYAFFVASQLGEKEAGSFLEYVEDIVAQADEVDGSYLQFDTGLATTALVVESSIALADKAGKAAPGFDGKKIVMFANYLLSRRFASQIKSVGRLASAIIAISKNKYYHPLSVSILPESITLSESMNVFKVQILDVLGRLPKAAVTVTVQSAKHAKTSKSLIDNKPMKLNELGVYELDFPNKAESGLYKFTVKVSSSDKKLIGISDAVILESRVVTPISIANAEVGVVDSDSAAANSKLNPVTFPNTVKAPFGADHHQKLMMRFQVKDSRLDKAMQVHQAFVRFEHSSGREVVFVAEPESSSLTYKFDLPVNQRAKDFNHISGEYKMYLIIGDAAIQQSVSWPICNVRFHFDEKPAPGKKIDHVEYKAKPEIKHEFRKPEKRPAEIISLAFTAICLSPALLLFVLWGKLGANVSNMEFGLSTLGFHGGLAAIFGLFGMFFLSLDMFTTLKYLVIVSVPTFVFGNRVLASIAAKKA